MEEKKCPVDRGNLLISLECCRKEDSDCRSCPITVRNLDCMISLLDDALAYILYLEERLGVTG